MGNYLQDIEQPKNLLAINFYLITLTLTSVGYGDGVSMPNLPEYKVDYTLHLGCMITGIFLFNIQQAKLAQFFSNLGEGNDISVSD